MHIVIFVDFHDSTVGGVQTSVRGQRRGLEALGHVVTIVSPPPLGAIKDEDPAVICVPSIPFFRPNGFPMVAATKANEKFIETQLNERPPVDVVHVQTNMGLGILGIQIAKKHSLPVVQTMHGRDDVFAQNTYPLPRLITSILRGIHRHYIPHETQVSRLNDSKAARNAWQVMVNHAQAADHVIMPSHHFSVKFKEHGLTRPVDVISNGISDDIVAKVPKSDPSPTGGNILRVIWCGRLSAEKRPLDSIKAIEAMDNSELDLYGDGPLAEELRAYIDNHKLSDRIHLKGKVSQMEILDAMQQHDVLLYPSFGFDNQPMVLLEAVVAGIPVVYCDPDLAECMPVGGALMASDGMTVEALSGALTQLLNSPQQRKEMREAMYDYRPKVTQSYHSKKMVALYERLIDRQ